MTRRLLVPMDDSEPARAALEHTVSLFPDDEVTVLHVVDDLEAGYGGGRPPVTTGGEKRADEGEPDFFADVRSIAAEYDTTVETTVIEGTSADAILDYAREHDADQIVMGSRGRSGVSRMLLGSIAEAVTRRSPVPVTIVP